MSLSDLIPSIQLATGPVILISGVGMILLSMTNRLGRVIDRSRQLARALHDWPWRTSCILSITSRKQDQAPWEKRR